MDKNVEISILSEIYGKLLTDKQYNSLNDYYNFDLSLSEIAQNLNISRQGVRDNIKKGEAKLYEYESKLGIMKNNLKKENDIKNIISIIDTINTDNLETKINKVKNELTKLI